MKRLSVQFRLGPPKVVSYFPKKYRFYTPPKVRDWISEVYYTMKSVDITSLWPQGSNNKFKGDNLMKIMNAIMQAMYEYVKHQDYIRYNSLYKMSKR